MNEAEEGHKRMAAGTEADTHGILNPIKKNLLGRILKRSKEERGS
jgi:hypothetical protein